MRVNLVSAIALALGIVGGAQVASAADLAVKAPVYKAPPPPAVFSWTGFYVGANFGGAWGSTTATDILATNGLPWVTNGGQWGSKLVGFTGGGQAGYNFQFGNLVLGVESDIGYLGLTGSGAYPLLPSTTVNTHGGVFSTARGRLGFAVDHWLIYGTGGWFGANFDSTVNQNSGGTIINTASTGFQSGWTAGGGVEWAFAPQWSVKGEYLHYDVGDQKIGGSIFGGTVTQFFNVKNSGDLVRTGINYHF
jgi:outer membrane immunogenic protein